MRFARGVRRQATVKRCTEGAPVWRTSRLHGFAAQSLAATRPLPTSRADPNVRRSSPVRCCPTGPKSAPRQAKTSGIGTQPYGNLSSTSTYSDRTVSAFIQLPADYTGTYGTKTWWRSRHTTTSGAVTDRTTWSVDILGPSTSWPRSEP